MTDNKGNKWHESNYGGYGRFGGKDIFELIAEMNGGGSDREVGVRLLHQSKTPIITPLLTEDPDAEWEDKPLEQCPHQGWLYPDDDEDDNAMRDHYKSLAKYMEDREKRARNERLFKS